MDRFYRFFIMFLAFTLLLFGAYLPAGPAMAQSDDTPTPVDSPPPPINTFTVTPPPPESTATFTVPPPTPTNTEAPSSFGRPLIIIQSYSTDISPVEYGQEVNLSITLYNSGQHYAHNIVLVFTPGEMIPRQTGGVLSVSEIAPGNRASVSQPLTAGTDLWGLATASIQVTISYYDAGGTLYTETFTLTFPLKAPQYVPAATGTATPTPTPTATAAPLRRPQLVITRYTTSVSPLEPGTQFTLVLELQNLGNADARRVTMIVGGGSANNLGTPDAGGGISGGSGEFTNFAPLGSSNIQSLGDLAAGATLEANQSLIVNATTNPGAYPMKISFVYMDEAEHAGSDEQIITLLVYSLPKVDISFYRDPGLLYAGQPNLLPVQIVNLGRKSAILGNLRLSAGNAYLENSVILVGALETGGYFTLDATLYPDQAGPLDLVVTVDFTDDFNQLQVISRTLSLEVVDAPIIDPPIDGGEIPEDGGLSPSLEPETLLQKLWRFILGLLGLDSARPAAGGEAVPGRWPGESFPIEGEQQPLNSPPLKMP